MSSASSDLLKDSHDRVLLIDLLDMFTVSIDREYYHY